MDDIILDEAIAAAHAWWMAQMENLFDDRVQALKPVQRSEFSRVLKELMKAGCKNNSRTLLVSMTPHPNPLMREALAAGFIHADQLKIAPDTYLKLIIYPSRVVLARSSFGGEHSRIYHPAYRENGKEAASSGTQS